MALQWNTKYGAFMDGDGRLYSAPGDTSSSYPQAPANEQLLGKPQTDADKLAALKITEAAAYAAPHPPGWVWGGNSQLDNEGRLTNSSSTGTWLDPSKTNNGFGGLLGGVVNGIGSGLEAIGNKVAQPIAEAALPLIQPAMLAALGYYGAGAAGLLGGAGGAAGAAAAPSTAVIDAAGNMIGGELATGAATSAPVYQGALGGWGALGAGAAGAAAATTAAEPTATAATSAAPVASAAAPAAATGPIGSEAGAAYNTVGAGTPAASGLLEGVAGTAAASSLIPGIPNSGLLTTGLNMAGSLANQSAASSAAQTQADAQIKAAQIAADAAKFKPVGVTTGFGSSQFGYDANGNLTSAGYNLTPEMKAQRDALISQSNGLLTQAGQAQAATAPMAQTAQTMMGLGQGYLATSPQAQAAKYYQDQQNILAPGRATDMANLQAQMQAQGRGGFAIGGGVGGQGAANPQLQALFNAQMQQNTQLSANATQGGMDYAKFGADMVGQGGNMLSSMYGVQNNAYSPYTTALNGANTVEGLGQNAMTMGANLGNATTAAAAAAGRAQATGITNAANTMAPSNAYSPLGTGLLNAANLSSGYKFDPMTGKAL
jgi:hypothetical protein